MRNPKRIDKFTAVLNYIWKTKCPDWRFTQLMENVFWGSDKAIWFMEEEESMKALCGYFSLDLEEVLAKIAENPKN